MKSILVFCLLIFAVNAVYCQIKEIPYTIDDRERMKKIEAKTDDISDRLIRVEEAVKALEKRVDDMNTGLNNRIDNLMNFMLWGFGITFAGIFTLIGFVIWDRRTAVAPVTSDMRKVKEIITELAKINPEWNEILKRVAL